MTLEKIYEEKYFFDQLTLFIKRNHKSSTILLIVTRGKKDCFGNVIIFIIFIKQTRFHLNEDQVRLKKTFCKSFLIFWILCRKPEGPAKFSFFV